jgi:hypothetical protein
MAPIAPAAMTIKRAQRYSLLMIVRIPPDARMTALQ